ncbi:hypothetical protein PDIDSM_7482 [Penicillium digitatum]|nr:hypothetical protein PDIDSM_7482 [Penicillium digitatum]
MAGFVITSPKAQLGATLSDVNSETGQGFGQPVFLTAKVTAGQDKGALAVRRLLSGNGCDLLHEDGKSVDILTVGLTQLWAQLLDKEDFVGAKDL